MRTCESCFDEVAVTDSDSCYNCIFCEGCGEQAYWVNDSLFKASTTFFCAECKPVGALEVAV